MCLARDRSLERLLDDELLAEGQVELVLQRQGEAVQVAALLGAWAGAQVCEC